MKTSRVISPQKLKELMDQGESILLVDIRDPEDYDYCHIQGAVNYPKVDFDKYVQQIPKDMMVVLACKYGKKSEQLVTMLRADKAFTNVAHLAGGLWDWSREIDPKLIVW